MFLETEITASMDTGLGKTDGLRLGVKKLLQSKLAGEEIHVDGHVLTREEAERTETPTERDGPLPGRRELRSSLFLHSINGLVVSHSLVRT